jgi:hypothetical protein
MRNKNKSKIVQEYNAYTAVDNKKYNSSIQMLYMQRYSEIL